MTEKDRLRFEIDATLRYHSERGGVLHRRALWCWIVMGIACVIAVVEPIGALGLPVGFACWFAFAHPNDELYHNIARHCLTALYSRLAEAEDVDLFDIHIELSNARAGIVDHGLMDRMRDQTRRAWGLERVPS